MTRTEIKKTRNACNWRRAKWRGDSCNSCKYMTTQNYYAGFGTRVQHGCKKSGFNTSINDVCDLFDKILEGMNHV